MACRTISGQPHGPSEDVVADASESFESGRLPALCWSHPKPGDDLAALELEREREAAHERVRGGWLAHVQSIAQPAVGHGGALLEGRGQKHFLRVRSSGSKLAQIPFVKSPDMTSLLGPPLARAAPLRRSSTGLPPRGAETTTLHALTSSDSRRPGGRAGPSARGSRYTIGNNGSERSDKTGRAVDRTTTADPASSSDQTRSEPKGSEAGHPQPQGLLAHEQQQHRASRVDQRVAARARGAGDEKEMDRDALRERRRSRLTERPGAERHAGWCGTCGRLTLCQSVTGTR